MRDSEYKVVSFDKYSKHAPIPEEYAKIYTSRSCVCFTHSADFDGIFSSEIVKRFFSDRKIKVIPVNYGDELFDTFIDKWDFHGCDVIITDFCFSDENMMKLADICNTVTWCDHHKTATERMKKLGFTKLKNVYGIQTDKYSAAELTWAWFFNGMSFKDMSDEPEILDIVGKYDTWRFKKSEKDYYVALQNGMKAAGVDFDSDLFDVLLYEINPKSSVDNIVVSSNEFEQLITSMYDSGMAVLKYNVNYLYKTYKRLAQDIKIKVGGKNLRGCALNANEHSDGFMYCYDKNKHDFCIQYNRLGDGQWSYGIYIMDDKRDEIDASKIAQTISPGGGGHKGAAGAETKTLIKEIRDAIR